MVIMILLFSITFILPIESPFFIGALIVESSKLYVTFLFVPSLVFKMFMSVLGTILAILSIVGLIYLYQLISGWLLRSKNACRQYTILQFDENEEDAEYILRGHISKIKSEHSEQYSRILCIEETMNSAMKHVCRTLEQEYPFVIVCSLNQVHDYITQ